MGINTELSVSGLNEYKSAFAQAQNAVKTLDAELKKNEAQFQATGDKEAFLIEKQKLLQQQLKLQKTAADQARAALKQMDDQGVNPMSRSYQDFTQKLVRAETAMLETTGALNQLKQGELEAASGADQLTTSVNGISKKISLDQVITGVDKISTGLENAAKRAINLGEALWNALMDRARWADDTATAANMLDMNVEDYQKYKKVFDTIGELTIQDWANAKRRVQNAIYSPSSEQIDILEALGISTHEGGGPGKYGDIEGTARDWEDVFWDVATRVQERVQNGSMTQGLADTYMQELFGKGYMNYKSLIDLGAEGFRQAVEDQSAVSEESVNKLAELNDTVAKLQGKFKDLESEVLSGLAPALTEGANAMSGLLDKVLEYLQTEDGQKMIADLGTAVSGLFDDLGKIDPEKVVSGFTSVFSSITEGLKWMVEKKETLSGILTAIVSAWGTAKLAGGALKVKQLIDGLQGLTSGGAAAGGAAGASWGSAFASAVLKAAPWITFLYETLKPGETVDNSLADATGNLTAEGWSDFYDQRRRASNGQTQDNVWYDLIMEAGEIVNGAAALWDDFEGINALARYANSRDRGKLADDLAALGYTLRLTDEELMADIPSGGSTNVESTGGLIHKDRQTGEPIVEVDPVVPDDAAGLISQQIGSVPVSITIRDVTGAELESLVGGEADGSFANGIPWVPRDGYLSILHRGERVMPARENKQYTYNSNTYFGSVNLHNGLEVDALTESIARNNRRKSSGYGA